MSFSKGFAILACVGACAYSRVLFVNVKDVLNVRVGTTKVDILEEKK